MIGIYLLVTLFSQFSTQSLTSAFTNQTQTPQVVSVSFTEVKGIQVGAPVVAKGQLIGNVTRITPKRKSDVALDAKGNSKSGFFVEVAVSPVFRAAIRRSTVALLANPLNSSDKPKTVLEFLTPPSDDNSPLTTDDKIQGFSSYEEFWSSASI